MRDTFPETPSVKIVSYDSALGPQPQADLVWDIRRLLNWGHDSTYPVASAPGVPGGVAALVMFVRGQPLGRRQCTVAIGAGSTAQARAIAQALAARLADEGYDVELRSGAAAVA